MSNSSESQAPKRSKHHLFALPSRPLTGSDLHIWFASLNSYKDNLSYNFALLSQEEKARVKRFYFQRDRNRFIVGRGLLRTLIGGYLDMEPARIEFEYGDHGKPVLKSRRHEKVLEFNLSHSKDRVIYAFSCGQPIGIDIEYIHPMKDMDDFAFQFFTPNECDFIHSLSDGQKQESFFKLWTCKEAFLKANGSGLATPINEVEVTLAADGTASLTSIGCDQEQAECWRLEMFTPFSGFQAALAIETHDGQISFHHVNNSIIDE